MRRRRRSVSIVVAGAIGDGDGEVCLGRGVCGRRRRRGGVDGRLINVHGGLATHGEGGQQAAALLGRQIEGVRVRIASASAR